MIRTRAPGEPLSRAGSRKGSRGNRSGFDQEIEGVGCWREPERRRGTEGGGAEDVGVFVTKARHFPPLWMQVTLRPGLWTADENVTALSFRKCSSAAEKRKGRGKTD